jgi:hypothetical protein
MSTSAEKLVKQTIKVISKIHEIDYEELKMDTKKIIRAARNFDETLLGMMEEIMDLGNVGSRDELDDFNIEVLKIYCKIKGVDSSGSDKSICSRVWECIEEDYEVDSEDDDESEVDSDEDSEADEEPEPEPEPVVKKTRKPKQEKEVVIIG